MTAEPPHPPIPACLFITVVETLALKRIRGKNKISKNKVCLSKGMQSSSFNYHHYPERPVLFCLQMRKPKALEYSELHPISCSSVPAEPGAGTTSTRPARPSPVFSTLEEVGVSIFLVPPRAESAPGKAAGTCADTSHAVGLQFPRQRRKPRAGSSPHLPNAVSLEHSGARHGSQAHALFPLLTLPAWPGTPRHLGRRQWPRP